MDMLRSNFKIAYRNIANTKIFSAINIFGLSVGIASCLLIMLYVVHETSYDTFHKHADKIFRVVNRQIEEGRVTNSAQTPVVMGDALKNDYPLVNDAVRLQRAWEGTFQYKDNLFQEKDFFLTDPNFFQVFNFRLKLGNPKTALDGPGKIVITESIAHKFFGNENPIGKTLIYNFEETREYEVSGVTKDPPTNSHFSFDFLASFESEPMTRYFENRKDINWVWTYVVLEEGSDKNVLASSLDNFTKTFFPEPIAGNTTLELQALTDIHLYSDLQDEIQPNGNVYLVYIFSALALMILLIACINFMNLTTARSSKRSREVGIRKVLGSNRYRLISQFMGEAILISFMSVVIAHFLVQLFLPFFNQVAGTVITHEAVNTFYFGVVLLVIAIVVGIISGSYPAFYLSSFEPVRVLKGVAVSNSDSGGLKNFRRVLVTFQFIVSIICLIGVGVIFQQLNYIRDKNLGFSSEQVVYIRSPQNPINFSVFKNKLTQIPGVSTVTYAGRIPGSGQKWETGSIRGEGMSSENKVEAAFNWIHYDFVETFDLSILNGKDLTPSNSNETERRVLINETAVSQLGWGEETVGKQIHLFRNNQQESFGTGRVAGIIKDFHFESLHNKMRPIVMWRGGYPTYIAMRVNSSGLSNTISQIEGIWKELAPGWPMEFNFLDESIREQYIKEERVSLIISYFALLALIVACLGLLGLASFTAEQRAKEIGIRKVHGATTGNILVLLSKEYSQLIFFAFIIAAPMGDFIMSNWLENFAYHIDISLLLILGAGVFAFLLAIGTVVVQSSKVAVLNPINYLHNE